MPALRRLTSYLLLSSWLLIALGCGSEGAQEESAFQATTASTGSNALTCSKVPVAYVWFGEDDAEQDSGGVAQALRSAGFQVEQLPRDRSPWELRGLILLGSFASSQ